jgi:uncharacterized protein (DUF4415 family)
MRKEYDFSKLKVIRRGVHPVALAARGQPPKVRVSINLDGDVIAHFKALAAEPGALPYQTQINLALRRCLGSVKESPGGYSVAAIRDALLADEGFVKEIARRAKRR